MAVGVLIRILVLGAVYSGVWALAASGFTLVFGVGRILNFSHGIFFIVGAYLAYTFQILMGMGLGVSFILAIFLTGGLGIFLQKVLIDNLEEMEMIIIGTLTFALLVNRIIIRMFHELPRSIPKFLPGNIEMGFITISWNSILTIVSAFVILGLLYLFINKTRLGAAITATAQDQEMAKMVGVNVGNIQLLTMFLSAVLAAIAGVFYIQNYTITPEIGIIVLLFVFAIVILGGLGSIGGSIVGAFIVGYVTTAVMLLGGIRYGYIITLLIVIATLVVRPSGLFGKEARI